MGWREHREGTPPERIWLRAWHALGHSSVRGPAGHWHGLVGLMLLAWGMAPAAQDVTAASLKAAFIYHLPNFTEWPAGTLAPGSPFSLCVLGDAVVADEFERIVKGRKYGGRRILLSRLAPGAAVQSCQALYVGRAASRVEAVLAEVRERPVLTISDMEGFTKLGGITQLYFEGGQLRLFIDLAAANRARLKFSSRLLILSKQP